MEEVIEIKMIVAYREKGCRDQIAVVDKLLKSGGLSGFEITQLMDIQSILRGVENGIKKAGGKIITHE